MWLQLLRVQLFLVLVSSTTFAQYKVSGTVTDAGTDEPVPFASVFFEGKTTGTMADAHGRYELEYAVVPDSIFASAVGYEMQAKKFVHPAEQVNFKLNRVNYMIGEVVVYPGRNPANELLDSMLANKHFNNHRNLRNYSCESYTKFEIDFDNLDEGITNARVLKKIDFIFDHMDSTSEEEPFLPVMVTETLSDLYYRSTPQAQREIIKAGKISGVTNPSIREYLGSMYVELNIYENWINILGRQFISPIADGALNFYKYYIMDTASIEGFGCYNLLFKPRYQGENAFSGDLWVDSTDFAVKQISMQITADVNVNWIERASVYQEFTRLNGFWLPQRDKLYIDFKTSDDAVGIIGRKTTSFRNYQLNSDSIDQVFDAFTTVIVNDSAYERDDAYWQMHRHDTLSANEQAVYHMVDSLKKVPYVRSWVDVISTIVSGYKILGPIEVGPYFKLYSYNPVEGHRFRLGVRTSNHFSRKVAVGGYAAYGLRDERWKFGADFLWLLSRKPRMEFGLEWRNDLDLDSDSPEDFSKGNLLSGIYRRRDLPWKLLHEERYQAHISREWENGFSLKLSSTIRELQPYFPFYFLQHEDNGVADTITSIPTTAFSVNLRYAHREKFLSGAFERISLGSKYPIVAIRFSQGISGIAGSAYNFSRIETYLTDVVQLNPVGALDFRLSAGKIWGQPLPYLLLEIHEGNETYFVNKHAFNLMNEFEFASDLYFTAMFTQRFHGLFFNRLPMVRHWKWRSLATVKMAWGYLHSTNEIANRLNYFSVNSESFFAGDPYPVPYMEAGVGIENIFRLFRVDAIWRLTHRNNPMVARFGIRAGMEFRF
jgi:hypothetical protein